MSRLLAFVLPIIWFPDSGVATIAFAYFTAKSRVILVKLVICGENIEIFSIPIASSALPIAVCNSVTISLSRKSTRKLISG